MRDTEPFSEEQSSVRGSYNPNAQTTLGQLEMDNIPEDEDEDLDTTIKLRDTTKDQDEIVNILMKNGDPN